MTSAPPPPDQLLHLMDRCLELAAVAGAKGEVPIGALIWKDGHVISEAYNEIETKSDPTAHAEVLAIRSAAEKLGGWRLEGCLLCVTLEPCTMCTGALLQARMPTVVFAAPDPRAGALGSMYDLSIDKSVRVIQGIKKEESLMLLKNFFESLR